MKIQLTTKPVFCGDKLKKLFAARAKVFSSFKLSSFLDLSDMFFHYTRKDKFAFERFRDCLAMKLR